MQNLERLYENPFDDQKFLKIDDEAFEKEVNNLIEWCEDLDYEKYIGNWHQLATSAYSGNNNNNNNANNNNINQGASMFQGEMSDG